MREYELILNAKHMAPLLESLRLHRVAMNNAPSSQAEREIMADLYRRAELLNAVVDAGDNLTAAQDAYNHYCEYGDATNGTATVIPRPL